MNETRSERIMRLVMELHDKMEANPDSPVTFDEFPGLQIAEITPSQPNVSFSALKDIAQ